MVDDNASYSSQMKAFLARYAEEKNEEIETEFFSDGLFLVENYQARYDIIFMDIQMKMMDGMEAAEKIRRMDPKVILIFVTNYAQYAIKGYAVRALNYVLKPINYFDFSAVLTESIEQIQHKVETFLMVRQPNGVVRVPASDIYYIESSNHTLIYHTVKKVLETRGTLKELEEKLKNCHFSKCNNCYLVNLEQVKRIEQNQVVVGTDALAISRPKKKAFLEDLTRYMGGQN